MVLDAHSQQHHDQRCLLALITQTVGSLGCAGVGDSLNPLCTAGQEGLQKISILQGNSEPLRHMIRTKREKGKRERGLRSMDSE